MLSRHSLLRTLSLYKNSFNPIVTRALSTESTPIDFSSLGEHRSLQIERYGEPKDSVKLVTRRPEEVLPKELHKNQILFEHLVACINPADINLIQGVYGVRPELPSIVGNEGVLRVKQVGANIRHLKPGDLALSVGTFTPHWQSYSVQDNSLVFKVNQGLDPSVAAQIKVNPCTAYRMIKDFSIMKPGDVIIQNGANSAVGVYVIQLSKLWGLKTINVIRDRPNKDEVVKELKDFGADIVLTEEEVAKVEVMKPLTKNIGKPKLFLNCVGGKNAINCQKTLADGGYSVTYGAMSRQPFSLSATSLIFKDHRYVGFWVSRWYKDRQAHRREEIKAMLDEVVDLFAKGTLQSKTTKMIEFEERDIAFAGSNNAKYIFSINKS